MTGHLYNLARRRERKEGREEKKSIEAQPPLHRPRAPHRCV